MTSFFIFVFIFGAMIGSFLNVVIYRVPRDLNIVFPRSNCPQCGRLIPWYHNIPIITYLILRGKCSYCKAKISFRYFVVEVIMGFAAVYLLPEAFSGYELLRYFILFSAAAVFLCHFFIDWEHQLLPDPLNIYLGLVFLIYAILVSPWQYWAFGALIGGAFPYLVAKGYYLYSRRDGLGMGDVKLFAVLGLYLGPVGIVVNIFLSCFIGSIIGVGLLATKRISREHPIPFGPFIIIAASIQIFFPHWLRAIPFLSF